MRPIDADLATVYLNAEACKQIQQMPTVEAIPIAWLEEKLTNHPEIPYVVTDGIVAVLDMWREEYETY